MSSDQNRSEMSGSQTSFSNVDSVEGRMSHARRMMDPYGPFRGELTQERLRSMTSNVEMEDVSGSAQIINAQEIPRHPIYSGSTTRDKREFILKYNAYYDSLKPFYTATNSPMVWPVSACIEPWVKTYMALFEIGKPENEITEEQWMQHFRASLIAENIDLEMLDSKMSKLKLNLSLGDATSMMSNLGMKIYKIADDLGLREYVQANDAKRMVKYIVDALEPPAFKKRIESFLKRDSHKAYKKDPVAAHMWIREELKNFLEYSSDDSWKKKLDTKKESAEGSRRQSKAPVSVVVGNPAGQHQSTGSQARRAACANCGSVKHEVRFCPRSKAGEVDSSGNDSRAQESRRESREQDFRRKKQDQKDSNRNVRLVEAEDRVAGSGRLLVMLEGKVEAEALLDSGADCALISRGLVDELEQKTGFLKMKVLKEPETIGTAGSDLRVSRIVCLESVLFRTSAGPLRWRHLECRVDENDSGNLLVVDRPTMEKMGYSADALLVAAKDKVDADGFLEEDSRAPAAEDPQLKLFVRFLSKRDEALYQPADEGDVDEYDEQMLTPMVDSAEEQREQVRALLATKVEEAAANGLGEAGLERLRAMLEKATDVFRVAFANDPPINVEPLEIKLKEGARPVMASSRRYPPLHRMYLQEHMEELEKYGLVYKNPDARWGSAPRIVPKKDGSLRMTVDLRVVNEWTDPRAWPMPHQEAEMADLEGSTCFCGLDGFRQYWQQSLALLSRELLSIVTPAGIYTPTRVLMGATDAVAYTQMVMERVMAPLLHRGVKVWLDDVLGYARNEDELLDRLQIALDRCVKFGLKLHPGKCEFFKKTVKWCGRIISSEGVSHCPQRIQGLVDMSSPQTAADLQQFLCACNWMRASIPNYNEVVAELMVLLETCTSKSGGRKKTQLSKLNLSECGWEYKHEQALAGVKRALVAMVPLAHPRDDWDVCVYTDASQDHWGAIITQVCPGELEKDRSEQGHEPLAFLSGSFKGASSRWPIVEKEAYAIVETCKRMEYLLLRERGFHLFTDHRNLQYIFDPRSVNSNIARYQADKLQRWSMVLQMFRYEIEYIKGEENVWGDLLSRWGAKPASPEESRQSQVYKLVSLEPLKDEEFKWPGFQEIAAAQVTFEIDTTGLVLDEESGCWRTRSKRLVIPEQDVELKQRLCVIAHAGLAGHRGIQTTIKNLQTVFEWKGMQKDVSAFISGCLHCLVVDGKRVPRPFGATLTATRPNEVIHFDFLQLPKSSDGLEYVLVLKDSMSGFVELVPCTNCTAEACVGALCDWFLRYGPVLQWISDQGSHFKNQIMSSLAVLFGIQHHFVTAYCPWANGTVEVVNRMLLRVLKSMLSEAKLPTTSWSKVLFQVQMALNFNPAPRLNGTAPVTAFMALPAGTPLKTFYMSKYDGRLPTLTEVEWSEDVQANLKDLQTSLGHLHRHLSEIAASKLLTKRERQAVSARFPNFEVGDFVLVGRTLTRGNKLALEWKGPCRIVGVKSHWLYDVQTLFEPFAISTHHVSRLKFYVDRDCGNIEDFKPYAVAHQDLFLVDKLVECRFVNHAWEILVQWQGFELPEATWEPLSVLQADVPLLVKKCISNPPHPSFELLKAHFAAPP